MYSAATVHKTIAFVSNNAWSVYNFRLDVIRYLLQEGFKVLVIAPHDEFAVLLQQEGCSYVPVDFDNRRENPLNDLKLYRQYRKIYRTHQPAFIFHYVIKPNIYGSLAAGACHIPSVAVITGLGYPFAKRNWLYRVVRYLYKRALRTVSEVWFLNNEDAQVFIKDHIIDIEKVKVLPGEGINTTHFSPMQESRPADNQVFTFLMSTRLLKSKGIRLYVDAARMLKKKHYTIRCELVGFFEKHHPDSISQEDLERWQKEGLIHYGGFARDVRPFLQKADCFIFPSFYNEGIPRCLMEAAAMELPVITALNRGSKEVVLNNSTGYICNAQDPFDLADKMEKMINQSPEDRARMGRNGRALVLRKFDIARIINEYACTLQKLNDR